MFDDCIIKATPSDAESHEEQTGSKQYLVGYTTAVLQAVFYLDVVKHMEKKRKPKIEAFLKKTTFPASFDDQVI